MNSNKKIAKIDTKAILSTLWIFVLLNIIFRDIHEIVTPEFIEKTVNSVQPTEGLFLAAAMSVVPRGQARPGTGAGHRAQEGLVRRWILRGECGRS